MNKQINILVGTPAYNGQLHIDYFNSIMDFHRNKLPISVMCIGNESLITRGRNTILSYFYSEPSFSHLLFLDADIGIKAESIVRMLQHDVDVIGAPVPLKGFDEKGNKVYNVVNPKKSEDKKELYEVSKVGTAVFMLSRNAVNSLVEKAKENGDVYKGNGLTRGTKLKNEHYDIFKTGVEKETGDYLSEDYFACKTLRELGYKVYVDDMIITTHAGNFTF